MSAARVAVARLDGITSYRLSKIVAELSCIRGVKKAVLRVLADHYPNIFPAIETIAREAGWGTTQTRAAMRDLEAQHLISALTPKSGGRNKGTQYLLSVEKILALHEAQETQRLPLPLGDENPTAPDAKGNGSRTETQRLPMENTTAPVAKQRSNREKKREEKEQTANAAPSQVNHPKASETVEADAVQVEAGIRSWGIPLLPAIGKIIRRRLQQGVPRKLIECAVDSVLRSRPRDESKPQFFLAQNLDAEVESILAEDRLTAPVVVTDAVGEEIPF